MDTKAIHTNGVVVMPPQRTPEEERALIREGYEEAKRRDTLARHDKWHWKLAAMGLLGVCGIQGGLIGYLAWKQSRVQAYVQVVQVSEEGRVQHLGVPQDLLDFQPEDTQWLDMLSQWVRYWWWYTDDEKSARARWQWLYAHACGPAISQLAVYERERKPFAGRDEETLVTVLSRTKLAAPDPHAYQVVWKESTKKKWEKPVETQYSGVFSVARKTPTNAWEAQHNLGGLCVQTVSYDTQQVGKP